MQRMYFLQSNPCLLAGRLQSERQVILKICGFKCIRWEFDFPSLEMTGSKSAIEECTRILKVMVSESVTIAESALMMHDLAFANPGYSTTDGAWLFKEEMAGNRSCSTQPIYSACTVFSLGKTDMK